MTHASTQKQEQRPTGGSVNRPNRSLAAGTILEGRYQIQKVIGRGGMSTVYAARDLRFGQVERITAIKEMVDEDPDPGTRALRLVNFERESALLATITHSAVPKIYDLFSQSGLVYLVLEYIDGSDLERGLITRNGPYSEQDVIRWLLEIASVLKMLHNFEPDPIIFRDLKPSNIMLRSNGQIALIDFGIARMFQGRQRGTMIGTEGYAPPEQYRGIADARGDIYALGATLHHLITNSDPRQEAPFTFHERPVKTLNPEVSEEFAAIITKMVAYHPDQRYQTIEEVIEEAEKLVYRQRRGGTEMLRPRPPADIEPGERQTEQDVQSGMPQQTTVFTGPVQSSAAPSMPFQRRRSSRKRQPRRTSAQDQPDDRLAWQIQTGDEVRGTARWDGKQVAIGSYDHYLYAIDPAEGTTNWKFPTGSGVVARPARADNLYVVGSEDGSIYGVDADTGTLRWSCRTGRAVRSSAAIHDGLAIVGSDDASVYALEVTTGDISWRARLWGPIRSSPAVSGDNVLIGSDDGYLYCLDRKSGRTVWREPCGGPVRAIPAVNNNRVYVASWYGAVSCFDIPTGRRVWQHAFEDEVASSPSVQGDQVIIGVTDGALVALDIDQGSPSWVARYANQITSTALIGMTKCYISTIDGDCIAIDLSNGEMAWRHHLGGPIVSSPTLAGDVIVVGSIDGNIYGVSLSDDEVADMTEAQR
ncbi:PQQ-binding-like beta-propeller repeat protein [soil metagenome]